MTALHSTPAALDIRQDGSVRGLCRGPPQPTIINRLPCPITTTITTTTLSATHFNYQLQDIFNRRYGGSYHIPQQRGRKIPYFLVSFCLPSSSSLFMSSPPEMTFRNNSAAFTCCSTTGINANLLRLLDYLFIYLHTPFDHLTASPHSSDSWGCGSVFSQPSHRLIFPLSCPKKACTDQTNFPYLVLLFSCTLAHTHLIFLSPLFLFSCSQMIPLEYLSDLSSLNPWGGMEREYTAVQKCVTPVVRIV